MSNDDLGDEPLHQIASFEGMIAAREASQDQSTKRPDSPCTRRLKAILRDTYNQINEMSYQKKDKRKACLYQQIVNNNKKF